MLNFKMRAPFVHLIISVYVPVQIDEDDALRVVYQPSQLSGFVAQLLSLYGPVHSHCMNTQHFKHYTHSAFYKMIFGIELYCFL